MRSFLKWIADLAGRKFIPIRFKFTASMVLTILMFGAINFCISYTFVMKSAKEHNDEKVAMVASVISKQLESLLEQGDFAGAEVLTRAVVDDDPEILFITAIDPGGNILFRAASSQEILPDRSKNPDTDRKLSISNRTFPIGSGWSGNLVIGIDEGAATKVGRRFGYIMLTMTGFFLVVGIGGSMIFSYFISAPIYKILKGFDQFEPGGHMPQIHIGVNDELRLLAQGFQSMMERINVIDREYKSTQMKILETERLASMGTLATGLAHEINNPIAGIQMCMRRLHKSQNLDPRQMEYLSLISDATNHIKVVVQDLLSYAQESDKKKETTDLRNVIMDAANLVQPRLHRNNIHYHVELPVNPCRIQGVKTHLVQVIVNGIINSIDAIDQGGNIWVSLCPYDENFSITIEDDGIGVTPEVVAKAFEPFYTTKGKKGTGLGLYVSFGIILAHHGKIELRQRPAGSGTILAIDFPMERTYENSHS